MGSKKQNQFMMKQILILVVIFLGVIFSARSQNLNHNYSVGVKNLILNIDSEKVKFSNNLNEIPAFIIKGIKKLKSGFTLTDNINKFANENSNLRKTKRRFLYYSIVDTGFAIIAYKLGGFVSGSRFFIITFKNGQVDSALNFTIPKTDNINSLKQIIGSNGFEFRANSIYYW